MDLGIGVWPSAYLTNRRNGDIAISGNSSNESGKSEERLKKHVEFFDAVRSNY